MSRAVFGESVKRVEDPALLRGEARFIDDISLPSMVEAAFVRSPHAHAGIRGIDAGSAMALPGVHAVLTIDDLRPYLETEFLVVGLPSSSYQQDRNRPALAGDEVVYVGEPIAVVIAEDRYIAEDAAQLVVVDYDPLPAASDCRDALAEGAPRVHQDAKDNLLAEFNMGYGDIDAAFASAAHIYAESITQHRGGSHSIECRGAIASHDPGTDQLTLWVSSQMPHSTLRVLVDMLGRDENQMRVVTPDIGGGFGPKLVVYQEDVVVSVAAMIVGRPVKWIEDRREHFIATTQERDQYWEVEIAVDGEARILGLRGSIIHDHGAYTARGINLPQNSAESFPGPYEVPAFQMNTKLALTNKVPVTPVRGAGHPQAAFTIERLMDRVARELGLDRAEVRRRNLIQAQDMPYTRPLKTRGGLAVVLDSGDYPKSQEDSLARAGWDQFPARQLAARADGRYIGIGLANFVKGTGRGPFEQVTVRIGTSGRVHVYTGGTAIGQGTKTMLAQIVAEQLGGDMENVTVTTGDTAATALGIGTSNSRLTVVAGTSAHVAAGKVADKALQIAAHVLDAPVEDLEIDGTAIHVKDRPGRISNVRVELGALAHAMAGTPGYTLPGGMGPGLEATENVILDSKTFASGTAVVEVEVDVETGGVKILNYVLAHDCGRIINPMIVDGQAIGGTAHGIGNALYEWMGYDENGQPLTTNLADYLLVTATEMPRIDLIHHQSPSPLNPLGVKGVGECGVVPAPGAIISAVEDALAPFGVHIDRAPISPPQILALITQGRAP
ncbi:MAG: xanthine dehydrogenase family protein molybdopterin-binding subunit [Alphaproteobacteria bacterium]|nr:MAG: xanthine dehydrogenase family protein molybdopterin-binding subunit [Alphaproteobacteria bacterium]